MQRVLPRTRVGNHEHCRLVPSHRLHERHARLCRDLIVERPDTALRLTPMLVALRLPRQIPLLPSSAVLKRPSRKEKKWMSGSLSDYATHFVITI